MLKPEYGGPENPEWDATLHQPKPGKDYEPPAGKVVPEPEPDRPPVVAAPRGPSPPPVAPERFGPSTARVRVRPDYEDDGVTERDYLDAARRVLGRDVTTADLASLAGAPDDAVVTLGTIHAGTIGPAGGITLSFDGPSGAYHAERVLKTAWTDGKPVVENVIFTVQDKGRGLGGRAFGRQVEQAARLGIDRLETHAAGSASDPTYNGYSTWSKFGYDAEIPRAALHNSGHGLPPGHETALRISDLMTTKVGREWWTKNGTDFDGQFLLMPESRSRRRWEEYLTEKEGAATNPTSTTTKSP